MVGCEVRTPNKFSRKTGGCALEVLGGVTGCAKEAAAYYFNYIGSRIGICEKREKDMVEEIRCNATN